MTLKKEYTLEARVPEGPWPAVRDAIRAALGVAVVMSGRRLLPPSWSLRAGPARGLLDSVVDAR